MGVIRHKSKSSDQLITNAMIAEWLALEAEQVSGILVKALRRASRAAFLWPEEASDWVARGNSLTAFAGVGPFIEKIISRWLVKPPPLTRPPPLRQNFLTLADARHILAAAGLPKYRGDLQMHSHWSDGGSTIAQMAAAAQERQYEYIAITDHSKGLKIAGGIDERQLREQANEIAEVNAATGKAGIHVLHSIEMNLSPNGAGDMDPKELAKLHLVLGSFHSRLRVKEDQTERYLAAIHNPDIQILGHPRGRIYNFRIGLKADWPRVFAEAAKLDKAVELDAYPDRQDLDVKLLKRARDSGVKLAIDTDAHHLEQFYFAELGLAAAVLAKFPTEDIINFWPREKLLNWAREVRSRARRSNRPVFRPSTARSRRRLPLHSF